MKRTPSHIEHLTLITDGPLAWHAWIDVTERTYEGVRAAKVHLENAPIVAIAVVSQPGDEDGVVGLTWDDDNCNSLVNPERQFNDEAINTWFLGVWPRGEEPDLDEVRRIDHHLREMAWGRIRRQEAA